MRYIYILYIYMCYIYIYTYAMLLYVLCVSRTSTILFNPSTGAITDHCQSAKDNVFKSQLNVEVLGPPAVGGIRTHNVLIDNLCLTTRTSPLLANLKALYFMQWNQSACSHPLKIISSYQHFQIRIVYSRFLFCNATIQ